MVTHLLIGGVFYRLWAACFKGELFFLSALHTLVFKAPTDWLFVLSWSLLHHLCRVGGVELLPPMLDRNSSFRVSSVTVAELLSPCRDSWDLLVEVLLQRSSGA